MLVLHCKFLCLKDSRTPNYNFFSRSTIRIPSRQHEKGLIQLMRQKGNQTVIVLNFWWFVRKAEEKDFWRLKKFFSLSRVEKEWRKKIIAHEAIFFLRWTTFKRFQGSEKGIFATKATREERDKVSFQTIFGKRVITSSRESHQSHLLQPLDELQWIQWDKDYYGGVHSTRDSVLPLHPAALGSVLRVPKFFSENLWKNN